VYCDVVFNPLISPETFEQEGWHYHKEDPDQPVQYQGVVFNEMKGAFSDPIRLIFHHIFAGLMPGSTYAHESGGDPQVIPRLSYEQFRRFHSNHYHPSNCTFLLYGDAPLEDELHYLQDRFLKSFEKKEKRREVALGTLIDKPIMIKDKYSVESADTAEKTFLAVGTLVGTVADRVQNGALQIIANILYNSDGSTLKNKIISAGICKDFGGIYLSSSCFNTIMLTYLVGSEADNLPLFQTMYREALTEMVAEGLDRDLLISELNKYEFGVREDASKAQQGLDLISKALSAFKYATDPFDSLKTDEMLKTIRDKALNDHYFEGLIHDYLVDNPATVSVTLEPDPEKLLAGMARERKELEEYEATLDKDDRRHLVDRTRELIEQQQTPNDAQALSLLPSLSLRDLPADVKFHCVSPTEMFNRQVLVNELPTNRITYLDIGFDFSCLPHRLLPLLDLFGAVLTEIGTEKLNFMQFAKEAGICTGGLSHSINTYTKQGEPDKIQLIFWLSIRTLPAYLERAVDLLTSLFSEVSFRDRTRIKEIVRREFAWTEHAAQSEGYSLPSTRVFSHLSIPGRYQEQYNGVTAYQAIKTLISSYDQHEEQLIADLQQMAAILLNRNQLTISLTAEAPEIEKFSEIGGRIPQSLADTENQLQPLLGSPELPRHQAFVTAAEIVFAVQGGLLFPGGSGYDGSFEVLKTYLSRDYLWNSVRQMGGAYGCFIQFSHISGNIAFVSYRDPQVKKTYEAYNKIPAVISQINLSAQVMEQLIIGTYGSFDPHQSAAARGVSARNEYLSGIDKKLKQRRLTEITETTLEQLKRFGTCFEQMNKNCHRAIIGNRAKIEADKDLFDTISEL
ncbi:MAG: insulinase family protein, partial [Desulfocapsaceae bacterium]|nr:insulinase family protein [Desulfocapsaceae bacterium]